MVEFWLFLPLLLIVVLSNFCCSIYCVFKGNGLTQFLLVACINLEFWKVICVGKHSSPRFSSSWIRNCHKETIGVAAS
uniref:Uncharacterized protein n=1 Tax=Solanum lycopersicum TaxID=4081 RepID=A0A494G9Z7_SOLLC